MNTKEMQPARAFLECNKKLAAARERIRELEAVADAAADYLGIQGGYYSTVQDEINLRGALISLLKQSMEKK